jgi:hypothetical protein
MEEGRTCTRLCRFVAAIEELHRLATGTALSEEVAREYFHDPKALVRVIERSGVLDNPLTRVALKQLLEKELTHGV